MLSIQRKNLWFYGVLTALILLALYAYNVQLLEGLTVTSMRERVTWGLYIVNFAFFIGIVAGGLIIYSSVRVFGAESFKPITRIAALFATISLLTAVLFIVPDIGRPDRFFHIFLPTPNPTSPMLWDVTVVMSYLLILVIDIWFELRADFVKKGSWLALGVTDLSEKARRRDEKVLKIMSFIALPFALSIHSITAWIFGLIKRNIAWATPLMAPMFISSAMVSGTSLIILIVILLSKYTDVKVKPKVIYDVAKLLAVIIPVDLFLLLCEFLTVVYAHEPERIGAAMLLLTGAYSPLFWFEAIVGGVVPAILFAFPKTRRSTRSLAVACVLAVIGIWLKRWNLIIPGELYSLSYLGWAEYPLATYVPTWVEFSVMAGFMAFAVLLFTLGVKLLPMKVKDEKVEKEEEAESV